MCNADMLSTVEWEILNDMALLFCNYIAHQLFVRSLEFADRCDKKTM